MQTPAFPIDALLPEVRAALTASTRLVLEAPPGAGKTTGVPLALLDEPWLAGRKLVLLEPRRVAARAAAGFMARQLGEEVGATVGFRIRFERRVSERTRIEVVTEGILTRMLQDDPSLPGIGAVLFDEFHERHLAGDLGLALALDVQAGLREDLRLVVTSATLDGARLAEFLDAPRLSSAGRAFPVAIAHFPVRRGEAPEHQLRRAIVHALAAHPGDVLAFLPGRREIARVRSALEAALEPGVDVLELHGELPVEQQARVLQPGPAGRRRVDRRVAVGRRLQHHIADAGGGLGHRGLRRAEGVGGAGPRLNVRRRAGGIKEGGREAGRRSADVPDAASRHTRRYSITSITASMSRPFGSAMVLTM